MNFLQPPDWNTAPWITMLNLWKDNGRRRWTGPALRLGTCSIAVFLLFNWFWMLTPVAGFCVDCGVCKYSVRDVAFVNVHGKPWQLQLQKTAQVDQEMMSAWSALLRNKLGRSNVGFQWIEPTGGDAPEFKDGGLPAMSILESGEMAVAVSVDSEQTFDELLDALLVSRAREQILDRVVDSLCVFVLVESGNEELDAQARATCEAARDQVSRQMWTLEKPTDHGPALVVISKAESVAETWLLQSLGIQNSPQPTVAIVYGQGRRLGELLVGDQIDVSKLVGRASICGTDCECDLNRDWLYGSQLIHVWSTENERAAESGLSFDPNSAFVIAEVAQIIQKNSRLGQGSGNARVDLGGGLIIHDLEPIPLPGDSESLGSSISEAQSKNDQSEVRDVQAAQHPPSESSKSETPAERESISIPWPLLVGLTVVVFAVFLFTMKRQR